MCNCPETIQHIFIECIIAKSIWNKLRMSYTIHTFVQWGGKKCLELLRNMPVDIKNLQCIDVFPFYLWSIWLSNNDNYHHNKKKR